jgi:DNA-binding IclR family transcriptional regulator
MNNEIIKQLDNGPALTSRELARLIGEREANVVRELAALAASHVVVQQGPRRAWRLRNEIRTSLLMAARKGRTS